MIKHGKPPYLECSTAGDKRFSAFCATLVSYGFASIEEVYQRSKVFVDGRTNLHWRQAKGKRATNQAEVTQLYGQLWDLYIRENPELLEILKAASGLSDKFGKPGSCCQATELWRIRCAALAMDDAGDPSLPDACGRVKRIRPRLWNRSDPERPRRCISIMRPSPLGNPFTRATHPDRAERISAHKSWLREQPALLARIQALDDVDLVCCCSPMPCHGDAILELWDELNPMEPSGD